MGLFWFLQDVVLWCINSVACPTDNSGLVSFAQNKIASLRKICVNLRIAAGLFTNSSCDLYFRKHVKITHLVCECTRVRNLWLCSKSHWKLFSFFRDWHNNHRLRTYMYISRKDEWFWHVFESIDHKTNSWKVPLQFANSRKTCANLRFCFAQKTQVHYCNFSHKFCQIRTLNICWKISTAKKSPLLFGTRTMWKKSAFAATDQNCIWLTNRLKPS